PDEARDDEPGNEPADKKEHAPQRVVHLRSPVDLRRARRDQVCCRRADLPRERDRMTWKRVLWSAAGAVVLAAVALAIALTASLPRRGGAARVPRLSAPVSFGLVAEAAPRIRAETLEDAYRAQGFLHAQERFFQMDLSRRSAAGELAELVGPQALPLDRERRPFQFRKRARALAESLPPRHLAWLSAYVDGVNAGLADLAARPPEYWLLRARPEPWTIEDSLLVVYAFYTMLSNNEVYERPQAVLEATLPPDVYAFLTPST